MLYFLIKNITVVSHQQNMCNVGKRKSNTSGFIGVSFEKTRKKWRSEITVNNKKIFLGRFENIIDAAETYQRAKDEYHIETIGIN